MGVVKVSQFFSIESFWVVFKVANGGGNPFCITFAAELRGIGAASGTGKCRPRVPLVSKATGGFIPDLFSIVVDDSIDRFGRNEDTSLSC